MPDIQASFNAAIPSVFRLHQLLYEANEYSRLCFEGGFDYPQLRRWFLTLLTLYREVYPKLKDKDIVEIDEMINEFGTIEKPVYARRTPEGIHSCINHVGFKQHWHLLDNLEKRLRKLADKYGLLIPNKQGAWDAIAHSE